MPVPASVDLESGVSTDEHQSLMQQQQQQQERLVLESRLQYNDALIDERDEGIQDIQRNIQDIQEMFQVQISAPCVASILASLVKLFAIGNPDTVSPGTCLLAMRVISDCVAETPWTCNLSLAGTLEWSPQQGATCTVNLSWHNLSCSCSCHTVSAA